MNPADVGPQPSFELPKPQLEASAESAPNRPEQASAAAEQPLSSAPSAPPAAPAVNPVLGVLPVAPKTSMTPVVPSTASGSNPAIADDADVIEKEWVEKAKAIVAHTRTDPHAQNKEMSKFKADYLKKRYNKELKVSEE